jgi:hypothetical protein
MIDRKATHSPSAQGLQGKASSGGKVGGKLCFATNCRSKKSTTVFAAVV